MQARVWLLPQVDVGVSPSDNRISPKDAGKLLCSMG